jgi:hypothetical protein
MSPCAKDYMMALSDPFGLLEANREVCIPDTMVMPSYKLTTITRGSFAIGTLGIGFVWTNPSLYGNAAHTTNHCYITYTASNFASNSLQTSTTIAGVEHAVDSQFPYGKDISEVRRWRIVGHGLRVRYSGTELNRGGRLVSFSIDDEDLTASQANDLLKNQNSATHPVTRSWRTVAYRPFDPDQVDYTPLTSHRDQQLGFYVEGGTPGSLWEYQTVRFWELLPTPDKPVPMTTKSHSDITGLSAARDWIANSIYTLAGPDFYQKGLRHVSNIVLESQGFPKLEYMGL